MAALPLLTRKGEDEESALKRWLGYAFYVVTFGLLLLNISGAWIASNGNLFYTGSIAGAELFVALALGALIYTRNNLRFGVGLVVFLVGVYITLENGKMAVTHSMDNVFTGTPAELTEQARLADDRAKELDGDATTAKTNDADTLRALREEMAELKLERQLMQSQSKEGIIRAQTALKDLGLYRGPIDGIRENLTEGAMEARGEWARSRMDLLQTQIDDLSGVSAAPVAAPPPEAAPTISPAEAKRKEAIELRKQAKEVEERTVWLHILLIGLEGIRSLALWVFLMDGTMSASRLKKAAQERLALAKVQVEIAAIEAEIASLQNPQPAAPVAAAPVAIAPESVAAAEPPPAIEPLVEPEPTEPAPEPAPEPPAPPEMTAAQRRAQNAGMASQFARRAADADRSIPVDDWSAREDRKVA